MVHQFTWAWGVSKGQFHACQGGALAWGSVLGPGSSWGELDEQWKGQARDTVETYHQCPSPPKKGGPELTVNGPKCSPSFITTHCHPSTPYRNLDPETRIPSAWRLPTTKHLSFALKASAILPPFRPRVKHKVGVGGRVLGNIGSSWPGLPPAEPGHPHS